MNTHHSDLARLRRKFASAVAGFEPTADPLDAELLATFLLESLGTALESRTPSDFDQNVLGIVIPGIASTASAKALAILRALSTLTTGEVSMAAASAADRLLAAGAPISDWLTELSAPITVSGCTHISEPDHDIAFLIAAFHRAARSHVIVTQIDHLNTGKALDISLADTDRVGVLLDELRACTPAMVAKPLPAQTFREQLEFALSMRAACDHQVQAPAPALADANDAHYRAMARLLAARLTTLPLLPTRAGCTAPHRIPNARRHVRGRIGL
ncbi:hypothetical protein JK358_36370 [Nocardia sp. 2]|uniref:Uncharacterized protein n=1 Tax=Nocardia acididurans TaxID=2802282 RepID=A0ABS1MGU2_9NOCA|nr:hypothetical protein [Nocardia acididurans]MBL1079887.1 hypothetical protein [Nocardia acididurans]